MKFILILIAALVVVDSPVHAQTKNQAERLYSDSKVIDCINFLFEGLKVYLKDAKNKNPAGKYAEEIIEYQKKQVDFNLVKNDFIQELNSKFTASEIDELSSFYSSENGKKFQLIWFETIKELYKFLDEYQIKHPELTSEQIYAKAHELVSNKDILKRLPEDKLEFFTKNSNDTRFRFGNFVNIFSNKIIDKNRESIDKVKLKEFIKKLKEKNDAKKKK